MIFSLISFLCFTNVNFCQNLFSVQNGFWLKREETNYFSVGKKLPSNEFQRIIFNISSQNLKLFAFSTICNHFKDFHGFQNNPVENFIILHNIYKISEGIMYTCNSSYSSLSNCTNENMKKLYNLKTIAVKCRGKNWFIHQNFSDFIKSFYCFFFKFIIIEYWKLNRFEN